MLPTFRNSGTNLVPNICYFISKDSPVPKISTRRCFRCLLTCGLVPRFSKRNFGIIKNCLHQSSENDYWFRNEPIVFMRPGTDLVPVLNTNLT